MKFDLSALKNISPRVAAHSVLVLSVAIAAGVFVQKLTTDKAAAQLQELAEAKVKPTDIVPLAAEAASALPATATNGPAVMGAPQTADVAAPILPARDTAQLAMTTTPAVEPQTKDMPLAPSQLTVDLKSDAAKSTTPLPEATMPTTQTAANDCTPTLDLLAEDAGMIGLTLIAGCDLNQRVVLRHGGLSVTAITTATGALFASIPAMEKDAKVEVMFADGRTVQSTISIPEMNEMRRFAVQWQSDDAFQIHAFEGTTMYDSEGHVSAQSPHTPLIGQGNNSGFLTTIGDASVQLPMLAEVYTFPMDAKTKPDVIVEAAVTELTCGRDLLGETLTSIGGEVYITDLTVAMPDCAGIGDFLVLKNLVPELNITASN
ncbi:MAG: hypothetical protein ACEQSU_11500 [Microgenomates group bacterium]